MAESIEFLVRVFIGAFEKLLFLDFETFSILFFSLKIAFLGTLIGLVAALPCVFLVHFAPPRIRVWLFIVFQGLLSVPTVIVGTTLYLLLSKRGPMGALELMFTPSAILLGDVFLVVPLLTVFISSAISQVPEGVMETARNLGAGRFLIFRILLRECRRAIVVAACAGFGRVISEVGAAMILGGNIKGYTRTLTTAMVLETGMGETELAIALGILLLFFSFASVAIANTLRRNPFPVSEQEPLSTVVMPNLGSGKAKPVLSDSPPVAPIEIFSLRKDFGVRVLFSGKDFSLPLSGGTALMGKSGCGKSTLLRILAGITEPSSGSISVGARKGILVFQRPYLFSGTVRENLGFGLHIRDFSEDAIRKETSRLAGILGLTGLLDRDCSVLSGGEAVRVSIGRAMAVHPDLLLLDESLSHLDAETLSPILELLRQFVGSGGGLILVSHDEAFARSLCRNLVRLENGEFFLAV